MRTSPSPLVSVIIPLYNKERWIARCLRSVRAQTFGDYEVVVVDDGSTDSGVEIARTFLGEGDQLICQENSGPGAARNRGIGSARGEYVAFLDADDEWLPDHLEVLLSAATKYPRTAAVFSRFRYEGVRPVVSARVRLVGGGRGTRHETPLRIAPEAPARLVWRLRGAMWTSSSMVRRDVLREVGGFYERRRCVYGEDTVLWLKLLMAGPVTWLDAVTAVYHTDASQLDPLGAPLERLEPCLTDSRHISEYCPGSHARLLSRVLAARALTTAEAALDSRSLRFRYRALLLALRHGAGHQCRQVGVGRWAQVMLMLSMGRRAQLACAALRRLAAGRPGQ